MTLEEREKAFLLELTALTRKHGLCIAGCGCCGSPSVDELTPEDLVPEAGYGYGYTGQVVWIAPTDNYGWATYGGTIIKVEGLL